jgi:uncharacterized membrane protein
MPRAALTVKTLSRTATNISAANKATIALADGVYFSNSGKEFLYLENIHTSDVVVTIQTGKTVDGLAVAEKTVTLKETGVAGDIVLIGPFPTDVYNQSTGLVYVDVATDAVIKIIAVQMTPVA